MLWLLHMKRWLMEIDDMEYNHLVNEVKWFKKMMEEYRKSFWKVCDIVEKSSDLTKIKELTKKELERY